jgi:hypothetical protein
LAAASPSPTDCGAVVTGRAGVRWSGCG